MSESRCSLCMGGENKEDGPLVCYCDQCMTTLHPNCMLQLVNGEGGQMKWQVQMRVEQTQAKENNNDQNQIVFFPQPIERLIQFKLHQLLWKTLKWKPAWVAALRFVSSGPGSNQDDGHLVNNKTYSIALASLDAYDTLPPNEFEILDGHILEGPSHTLVYFESVPVMRCISCRQEKISFRPVDSTFSVGMEHNDAIARVQNRTARAVSFRTWLIFSLHVWCVAFLSILLFSVLFDTIGMTAYWLPIPFLCYMMSWIVVGGPMSIIAPHIMQNLQSLTIHQRLCTKWSLEKLRNITQQIESRDPNIAFLHFLRLICAPSEAFLLRLLVPPDYSPIALSMQGLICSRAAWTGNCTQVGMQKKKATILAENDGNDHDDHQGKTIHVESFGPNALVVTKAKSWKERLVFCSKNILWCFPHEDRFGGPSARVIVLISFFANYFYFVPYGVISAMFLLESLRLSMITYAAWIWIPNHMPRMVSDPFLNQTHRVLRPVNK